MTKLSEYVEMAANEYLQETGKDELEARWIAEFVQDSGVLDDSTRSTVSSGSCANHNNPCHPQTAMATLHLDHRCSRPGNHLGASVVLAVVQIRPPLGLQGRSGLGVAIDRGQQLGTCPQFHALPARAGGAFHDHRPLPFPGFDGIEVGGKPHAFEEGAHGSIGPGQVGFASVCHDSVAEPARIPAAGKMFSCCPPPKNGCQFIIVSGCVHCCFEAAAHATPTDCDERSAILKMPPKIEVNRSPGKRACRRPLPGHSTLLEEKGARHVSRYITDTGHLPCAGAAPSMPAVIAHRGGADDAPENTVAAFKLAWQQGVDGIEGDFHLTADGKIVCIHDADTKRTAGQASKVAEATLAELRRLDVGSWKGEPWRGARIPTLDEVLATVPEGKRVFIEIKCGPQILPALKQALARSGLQPGQTIVMSFDARVITEAKRLLPQLKALWLTDFKPGLIARATPSVKEILQTLEKTGADGVGCRAHRIVDQAFMQTLRTARKEVHLWTVDDVALAKRYLQLGVDSLTSNRAGWLKQQLCSETGLPNRVFNLASGRSR